MSESTLYITIGDRSVQKFDFKENGCDPLAFDEAKEAFRFLIASKPKEYHMNLTEIFETNCEKLPAKPDGIVFKEHVQALLNTIIIADSEEPPIQNDTLEDNTEENTAPQPASTPLRKKPGRKKQQASEHPTNASNRRKSKKNDNETIENTLESVANDSMVSQNVSNQNKRVNPLDLLSKLDQERFANLLREEDKFDSSNYFRVRDFYNQSKSAIYIILWNACTVALQEKFKKSKEFTQMDKSKNLLALWLLIYDYSFGTPEILHPTQKILDAEVRWSNVTQSNKTLEEFFRVFNVEVRAYINSTKKTLDEKDQAYLFISKLNSNYERLRIELKNDLGKKIDNYPSTLIDAYALAERRLVAVTHNNDEKSVYAINAQDVGKPKLKRKFNGNNNYGNKRRNNGLKINDTKDIKQCSHCGDTSHRYADHCPMVKEAINYFKAKKDGISNISNPNTNNNKNNNNTDVNSSHGNKNKRKTTIKKE